MNHREKDLLTRVQFGRPVKLSESKIKGVVPSGPGLLRIEPIGPFFPRAGY